MLLKNEEVNNEVHEEKTIYLEINENEIIATQKQWDTAKTFFLLRIYLFLERGEGIEKERKRNIIVWLPLTHPLLLT